MTPFETLENHPFVGQVISDLPINETTEQYTNEEIYINNCQYCTVHLMSLITQLQEAIEFLSSYKYKGGNDEIGRGRHFSYNYENYIIRIVSVNDRILQLINIVFDLGVHQNDVGERTVLRNLKVKSTNIPKHYKLFQKELSQHTDDRNTIIHRNSLLTDDIVTLEKIYNPIMIRDFEARSSADEIKRFKSVRSRILTRYINKTKKQFQLNLNQIIALVHPIFDELIEPYLQNKRIQNR